jgi:hypothetical protein
MEGVTPEFRSGRVNYEWVGGRAMNTAPMKSARVALLAALLLLMPSVAPADAPDGDAAFAMSGATHPILDMSWLLLSGNPIPFSFDDPDLGLVDIEMSATGLNQDVKGRMIGSATVNQAAGSPMTVTLDCDLLGRVKGKDLITKFIIKVTCEGEIDDGTVPFPLPAEAKLKLAYIVDPVQDLTVEKRLLRIEIAGVPFSMSDMQVLPGVPPLFPPALDWDLDLTVAPDPNDPTGTRLLGTATASLTSQLLGSGTIDFTGVGKYDPVTDSSKIKFKSLEKGAAFALKNVVVNPASIGPDDALESYELKYKVMGQKGSLIVPPVP